MIKREVPIPCDLNDLNSIDYLLLSHDHRDHFDIKSLGIIAENNPNIEALLPLNASRLLEAKEFENAERYLLKWYSLNKHNPLINLNLWIVNMEKNNLLKAKIYFKNTIKEDANWDFWKLASEKLALIILEEKKTEELINKKIKLIEAGVWDFNQ